MLPSKKVLTVNPSSKMENEEYTVDDQDETKEVESTDEESEQSDDESEDEVNSTQLQSELEKQKAENAKLQRLLKKAEKKEEKSEESESDSKSPSEAYLTKAEAERLRLEIKGYDDDQIDLIMKLGGVEALKDVTIKDVVEKIKEEKQQLNAQASSKSQSKSSKHYSQEDLRAMPLDKLEKLIREGKIKSN